VEELLRKLAFFAHTRKAGQDEIPPGNLIVNVKEVARKLALRQDEIPSGTLVGDLLRKVAFFVHIRNMGQVEIPPGTLVVDDSMRL